MMSPQGVIEQMRPFHIPRGIEAFDSGQFFRVTDTRLGQMAGMLLFFHFEMDITL